MTEQELRLACLKLAYDHTGGMPIEKLIELACTYAAFVLAMGDSNTIDTAHEFVGKIIRDE